MEEKVTWKQKARRHAGKRFRSKLALDLNKNRKIKEAQECSSLVGRVRFVSGSKDSDPARLVISESIDEEEIVVGSGQTPSVPELVSIVTVRSPAKPQEEEGVD